MNSSAIRVGLVSEFLAVVLLCASAVAIAQVAAPPGPLPRPAGPPPLREQVDPGQYHYDLAQVHVRYGKVAEAKAAYAQALEVSKTDAMKARILAAWGEFLLRNDEPASGREKLQEAMAHVEDKNAKSRMALSLARAFQQEGNLDEAVLQYRTALETTDQPWLREAAVNQMLMAYSNELDELTAHCEADVKKNPKDAAALEILMTIYSRMTPDVEKAIQAASRLVALRAEDPEMQLRLADLYARAGKVEQAVVIYGKLSEHAVSERIRDRAKRALQKLEAGKGNE